MYFSLTGVNPRRTTADGLFLTTRIDIHHININSQWFWGIALFSMSFISILLAAGEGIVFTTEGNYN